MSRSAVNVWPAPKGAVTAARLVAAALVLAGGFIHLRLWAGGYRALPAIGPLFLANAVASAVVGIGLVFTVGRAMVTAGLALSLGAMAALITGSTVGLFGFSEGWSPSMLQTLAAELGAIVAIGAAFTARQMRIRAALVPLPVRSDRKGS